MKIIKYVVMFLSVCIISYFSASIFGNWYDKISPQYDGSLIGLPKEIITLVPGFLLSYAFLITFIFELFGSSERRFVSGILLLPIIYIWFSAERSFFYIPVILIIAAFVLAQITRFIFLKLKG